MTKREIVQMQIKRIEKEIRDTPYHKGTERHIGLLRARLAKLKEQVESSPLRQGLGGASGGYAIRKQGDATVVLVGPPSSGKSSLLNTLTNAESKVAPYAFTTVTVIPGMLKFRDAYIQILDVPGLIEGAEEGKGRGREVLSVVRGADLLIIMSDVDRPEALMRITNVLEEHGIRINKTRPKVKVDKRLTGGLLIKSNLIQELDKETVKEIASEFGIKNADITINEKVTMEMLMDVFAKNRVYVPSLYVLNKAENIEKRKEDNILYISAQGGKGIDELKMAIWEHLSLARVYLVKRDEEPNTNNPIIIKDHATLRELAENIGAEFAESKTRAKIWGTGAKFPGQEVSLRTHIEEGMQIRFI